jgi:hypothetical protein
MHAHIIIALKTSVVAVTTYKWQFLMGSDIRDLLPKSRLVLLRPSAQLRIVML